jgi:(S)-3,5-dihydroxyphenylglycine transaminase
VSWNSPEGGFFVVVDVPFDVTDAVLERSARDHRVLWTPLHHFYDAAAPESGAGAGPLRCLRLSCSALGPEDIEEALDRFAAFVRSA